MAGRGGWREDATASGNNPRSPEFVPTDGGGGVRNAASARVAGPAANRVDAIWLSMVLLRFSPHRSRGAIWAVGQRRDNESRLRRHRTLR